MNHRNSKNGKRSNGVVKCWSLGPHHSTTPSLRSAFSLIEFIGRLANIMLGRLSRRDTLRTARRFNVGNNSKGASPAAAPALGRVAIASCVQPGLETPGCHRSSLRSSRPVRRRTNCRNSERSVEAANPLNRLNR